MEDLKSLNSGRTKIRAIITGATGMVGEGVLYECLNHPEVEQVLVINRTPCGVNHPKLKEIVHSNFFDLSAIEDKLVNYNACFFCLGVSSIGMKEEDYTRVTYDLTMYIASLLVNLNPDMVFCYVTGGGTDSTEQGRSMWARVKGRTENHLLQLPFKGAYMFRPAYIHSHEGLKRTNKYYKYVSWLYPLRRLFPDYFISIEEIGLAMINSVKVGYEKPILEVRDIVKLANKSLR